MNHIFSLQSPSNVGGRFVFLSAAVLLMLALAMGCGASDASPEPSSEDSGSTPAASRQTDALNDYRVRSELVFNTRADLAFQLPGEVGTVNVSVGDRVSKGDILATLDSDTLTDLRHAQALAEFKIEQTQDELDRVLGLQSEDPLIRAQSENALAKAEVALERAEDELEDYQLEHDVALGKARQAVADSTAGLDRAQEAVTDFAAAHGEQFAGALAARAKARSDLATAEDAVSDFLPLYDESVSKLRSDITQTELAIDRARDSLRDFDKNHADSLASARQNLALAENRLDEAQDVVDDFFVRIANDDFHSLPDGQNFDVVQLNAVRAAVDTAQRAVDFWNREIAELRVGPKEIDRVAIENRIGQLESTLELLRRRFQDALVGPDEDELRRLETNVLVAQERLNTADRNLAEVEEGVDQIELARLETAVASARITLESAESRLERLEEGPDDATIAALSQAVATAQELRDDLYAGPDPAAIALAQANVADALVDYAELQTDLEDTVIRAPFDGLVRLVTIDPDDVIRVDARVIQLVDPTDVTVRGLVETNYIERITPGTPAAVTLAAIPGTVFDATVESVSQEARTERGVISFPVDFSVVLPEGVEIPPNPGLVTTVINPQDQAPGQRGPGAPGERPDGGGPPGGGAG